MEQLAVTDCGMFESRNGKGIFRLTSFLAENNLLFTPVDTMLSDLAKRGDLLVVGGEARRFMGYEIVSHNSDSNSLPKFEREIGIRIPYLDVDFKRALIAGKNEIDRFAETDLDLISPHVDRSLLDHCLNHKDFRHHYNRGNIAAYMGQEPLRLSIFTPERSKFKPFKIDITSYHGNARFRESVTTFDKLFLPVDSDLNVKMDGLLFNIHPPLGIVGDLNKLCDNYTNPVNLAIAVRFLAQSLMVLEDFGRVPVHFGENIEDKSKMNEWLTSALSYIILNREKNPRMYQKLLYTVIPNWKLFDDQIKTIIRNSFLLTSKTKEIL